jgi:hypothetical protein
MLDVRFALLYGRRRCENQPVPKRDRKYEKEEKKMRKIG